MAHFEGAFPISDGDVIMDDDGACVNHHRPPVKEIAFALCLLVLGALGIAAGTVMAAYRVGGDRIHGIFFAILGLVLFIPGFYYTRIAYYAYRGYQGFSFSTIPPV